VSRDPSSIMREGIQNTLRAFAAEFDGRLDALLACGGPRPADLAEAVRYSVLASGKRVRPYLLVRCCELVGGTRERAWPAAAAIECVHAFSLVHDDLPAMDDDDLRRGRATTHKKFGEALAILAGDALLALSFELVARMADARVVQALVSELAGATGWSGMIGGQAQDLAGENQPPSLERTRAIHRLKTGRLFAAACRMGAICGGGTVDQLEGFLRFGGRLGEAFQIADDLLDLTAGAERLGKTAGKDAAARKQTYPACVGAAASRAAADAAVTSAVAELAPFGPAADDLRELAAYVVVRDY